MEKDQLLEAYERLLDDWTKFHSDFLLLALKLTKYGIERPPIMDALFEAKWKASKLDEEILNLGNTLEAED